MAESRLDDHLLFFSATSYHAIAIYNWVQAQITLDPKMTVRGAIRNFCDYYDETDYDHETLRNRFYQTRTRIGKMNPKYKKMPTALMSDDINISVTSDSKPIKIFVYEEEKDETN